MRSWLTRYGYVGEVTTEVPGIRVDIEVPCWDVIVLSSDSEFGWDAFRFFTRSSAIAAPWRPASEVFAPEAPYLVMMSRRFWIAGSSDHCASVGSTKASGA